MHINIGKLLKAIAISAGSAALGGAITTATAEVPGTGPLISGVGKLLDRDDDNNQQGVAEIEYGLTQAMGSIDPSKVTNAIELAEGVQDLQKALKRIGKALKPAVIVAGPTTPVVNTQMPSGGSGTGFGSSGV